jgi:hypothetical protein
LKELRFKRKKNKIPFQFKAAVPFVFLLAIMWVWKSTAATNLSRQLTGLDRAKSDIIEENKRLSAELEKYRSISWIDTCVRFRSNMTYDVKNRLILYEKSQIMPKSESNLGLYASVLDFIGNIFKEKR